MFIVCNKTEGMQSYHTKWKQLRSFGTLLYDLRANSDVAGVPPNWSELHNNRVRCNVA